ncbi:MAG: FISUMP domain-containing protein [Candidatus Pacebacteria bacterium]|nr:FISUMP domain-containing protein [Candidatus Paceibacterota bacterium]
MGINGGTTATCTATKAISGVCGSSDGANLTSIPTENLCSAGTASSVSGTGPWTWSCLGINGGTTDSCATGTMPVNGVCGSSDGEGFYSTPTENLCSAGMASSVSGTGPWTWECVGLYGGTTDSCSATFLKGDQATPAAPTLSSKTSTTVILSSCTGCEYRRDGGTWQSSNTFSGLSPLTTYSFTQRLAETETLNASPESAILSVTTDWACGLAFVDPRDGQSYTTKQYGSKCWMTQNLNYASTYGICYSNNATYCLSAGRLYNAGIYAGLTSICPTGWHTPNLQDWVNLDTIYSTTSCYADNTLSCAPAGTALKAGGVSGFEAPLGGYYYRTAFGGWGTNGAYLAYYDGYTSGYHFLYSTNTGVSMGSLGSISASNSYYFSVRCIKD